MKIYGTRMSRAGRCMWLLEELGLDYNQIAVGSQDGSNRTPEFLAINPAGKVPVLDDDGFVLRESLAIALYLVAKVPTPLWPDDPRTRGLILQWASWAATELEAPLSVIFVERRRAGGAALDPAVVDGRIATARAALDVLEGHLATHSHVADDRFTLGDLIASSTVALAPMFIDLAAYPAVQAWMARCTDRPARQRAEARA